MANVFYLHRTVQCHSRKSNVDHQAHSQVIVVFVVWRRRTARLLLSELTVECPPDGQDITTLSTQRRWSRPTFSRSDSSQAPLHHLADRLMVTCLRISAYPLALILTNGTTIGESARDPADVSRRLVLLRAYARFKRRVWILRVPHIDVLGPGNHLHLGA